MKTQILDSTTKRISIAVAVLAGVILIAAGIYTFFGGSAQPVNGIKVIAAAQAYTRALRQQKAPIPPSVPLQTLIDQGLLQPADVGSFQGMDATISLTANTNDVRTVLMRVHMPDGTDLVLYADGTSQGTKR